MTLHEFLTVCNKEEYIGIWDISVVANNRKANRKNFGECPTEQNYFKIANIPYGRIMYLLHKEVFAINHTAKGFLVRVHNKGEAEKHLDMMALAREIGIQLKER